MPREENIADFALEAIIQSQHECNYSSQLNTLLDTCELLQERIPGYRVKIGFGLHAGWAVEGALGSKHKIDCTYLGPHQDMSERLETATKLYGTPVLTTDSFYVLLSAQRQRTMRIVDRVLCEKLGPKGASVAVTLYAVAPGHDEHHFHEPKINTYSCQCEVGMKAYIDGEWARAAAVLRPLLLQMPEDRPVQLILGYMQLFGEGKGAGMRAPSTWQGYRETVGEHLEPPYNVDV